MGPMDSYMQAADSTYPGTGGNAVCPSCQGTAYRVPRRWIDRLTSRWRPVWRYECQTTSCRRVFNLPARRRAPDPHA